MKLILRLLRNIERKVAFRTYEKYTTVKTGLKPDYYDKDKIMLYACFSLLVDFVEIELAWLKAISDKMSQNRTLPNFISRLTSAFESLFLIKRSETLGRAYLNQMLNCTDGCIGADDYWKGIKELYEWWKDVRPQRKDPIQISGFEEYLKLLKQKYGDIYYFHSTDSRTIELKSLLNSEEDSQFLDLAMKTELIEERYDNEDDEMLLKLCRLRRFLWT